MSYSESELRWVINSVSGVKRQIGPNIYKNQFRMKSGNWQFIDAPTEDIKHEPVTINLPPIPEPIATDTTSKPIETPAQETPEIETVVSETPAPKTKSRR